jgi:phospholipid/cholesterol/gamma-HCH transport system permease protein
LQIERHDEGRLLLRLAGSWQLREGSPRAAEIATILAEDQGARRIVFDASDITDWDTALAVFLWGVQKIANEQGIVLEPDGLPEGARRLLTLASAVPPASREGSADRERAGVLTRVGEGTLAAWERLIAILGFLGEVVLAFLAFFAGRARYRKTDLGLILQSVGPQALPIVTLISFLVGVILAFVGAIQLSRFGAQIFIADLVGLAMAREMGPMMAAIIMTGRTGAAFAAQIGTMQVNHEVDALKTLGISPIEFLVLPRVLSLVAMMPLLTLYADLVGIFGGLAVSVSLFEITFAQYWNETMVALSLDQFVIGLAKAIVFGALIAISGCYHGMIASGSAAAVGSAATSAVVAAIVAIVVADGLFAVMLNALGL